MKFDYLKTVWTLLFQAQDSKNDVFLLLDTDAEQEYQQGLYFEQLALNDQYQQYMRHQIYRRVHDHISAHATSFAYLNERNAIWCFLRSALRGHPEAEYKMGLGYLNGQLGLDRDYRKAETWLKRAAKDGHPDAKRCLYDAYSQLAFS
ncbi:MULTISPECIES: SEL1-like repeat protein [Acinetobacter]|uniref:SEL1-like repeat protein n=1 Tax=Acinetobacter TaxID=469 RepID=UPI000F686862|nr:MULTISPECIES: SEL1-like repeat protein [Acinetobacter]RSC22370.1 sel1 repeat family protein [Acinetobacter sp. FDAARGOS_515]